MPHAIVRMLYQTFGAAFTHKSKSKKLDKKVEWDPIVMYDSAWNICQDLHREVNEIIYAFSLIHGHNQKIINVFKPGNHTNSDLVLSTRHKGVIVTGSVIAITGLASLFT